MPNKNKIKLIQDDITTLQVDAIVNAANESLLGGGGVDGAIHSKAGKALHSACVKLKGCKPGEAKITPGFELHATYIIHTVGPIWYGGSNHEAEVLASCYKNALKITTLYAIKTIAFPAISCGAYGFPIDKAASIALDTITSELNRYPHIKSVIICTFLPSIYQSYQTIMEVTGHS